MTATATARVETADQPELDIELDAVWRNRPGFIGWLTTTDHKSIAKRYVATAFIFFLLAGLEAAT
ncbi:MAG TPA: hypothetical protein VFN39_02930, partial [Gemmatimonadaceae bacterium]|nr:hypothetical protein [Gemmatimonadaceae bacterium]